MRRTTTTFLSVVAASAVLAAGCGGSGKQVEKTESTKRTEPVETRPADPLSGFTGKRYQQGEEFVLDATPVAIVGAGGLQVMLQKVDEEEYVEPGREPVINTRAVLTLVRGEESRSVSIAEEDAKTFFGCKLAVKRARVDYIEDRQDYLPRVTMTVTCK